MGDAAVREGIGYDKLLYSGHVLFAQQHLGDCEDSSRADDAREHLLAARQHIDWALEKMAQIEARQHEQGLIDDARGEA